MTKHDVQCRECDHEYTVGVNHKHRQPGEGYGVVAECPKCKAYNGEIGVTLEWSAERDADWKATSQVID